MSNVFLSKLLLLNIFLVSSLEAYTVEDINGCVPCQFGTDPQYIIHPTNCNEYFYCTYDSTWLPQACADPAFQFDPLRGWCIDAASNCSYSYGGRINNLGLDIEVVYPYCNGKITVIMSTSSSDSAVFTATTTSGSAGSKPRSTTTILASLLGVTFFILILVLVAIVLYRWRQKLRRPRHFYSSVPRGSTIIRSTSPRPPQPPVAAANVNYVNRSKLKEDDVINSDAIYEMPESEEAGYMEIPDRTSKAYYSDPDNGLGIPARPLLPLPGDTRPDKYTPNEYDGKDVPKYTVDEEAARDAYVHPGENILLENHVYAVTSQGDGAYTSPNTLEVAEPYEYCRPESAHPTLSFRRDSPLPPLPKPSADSNSGSNPQSPPYYVDPSSIVPEQSTPHQYHTLEPLKKGAQ